MSFDRQNLQPFGPEIWIADGPVMSWFGTRTTALGHEGRVPATKAERPLSVQSRDLRGDAGNGGDAPKATIRASGSETAVGHCEMSTAGGVVAPAEYPTSKRPIRPG